MIHGVPYVQGGLFDKWMKDILDEARSYGRKKRLEEVGAMSADDDAAIANPEAGAGGGTKPLTLVHLQGPLLLLLLGLGMSLHIFCMEIVSLKFK